MTRTIKYIFTLIVLSIALCGCNQEDDVFEIFSSGTWRVNNYYTDCNWNNLAYKPGNPVFTTENDLKVVNSFTVVFEEDGSMKGEIEGGTFTARWNANAKDRSFSITNITVTISLSGKNAEFITRLKNVKFYQGDSNTMQLAPQDKTTYIQFNHRFISL